MSKRASRRRSQQPSKRAPTRRNNPITRSEAPIQLDVPNDVHLACASYLSVTDLCSFSEASRRFSRLCRLTDASEELWRRHCMAAWQGKFIDPELDPRKNKKNRKSAWREALRVTVLESREKVLTEAALCSKDWAFRFKAAAGEHWQAVDPYWQQPELAGEVAGIVPRGSGTPNPTASVMRRKFVASPRHAILPEALLHGAPPAAPGEYYDPLDELVGESNLKIQWRFTKSRAAGAFKGAKHTKARPLQFLQVNRWPSSHVVRHEETWGWVMHNQWVVYCSPPQLMERLHHLDADVDRFWD